MPTTSRTFRIFVSSTFSDLKAERNALQRYVFPKLRELCMRHGCRFQAIDLRWGVSEEATLDQQTMNICVEELHRCQRTSPRPNFIVLLGQRYGWCPLPPQIDVAELDSLLTVLPAHEQQDILQWYRRDDNAVPAEYCLQPRGGRFKDGEAWATEERELRAILREAVTRVGWDAIDPRRIKYEASATHQEILQGALQVKDNIDHVFGFFRTIEGMPQDATARDFLDLDPQERPDEEARGRLDQLQTEMRSLLPNNIHSYSATWAGTGPSATHLKQLCADVCDRLSRVIEEEVKRHDRFDKVEQEAFAHQAFGQERARVFIGRQDLLRRIQDYVAGRDQSPLVLHGLSGSGKSALMAKATEQQSAVRSPQAVLVVRYIGATPESRDIRSLLKGLCEEIVRHYDVDASRIPEEYSKLEVEFQRRLALATAEKPLVLFLDALDQLSETDLGRSLTWLPVNLPEHVKLVVSVLQIPSPESTDQTQQPGSTDILTMLRQKIAGEAVHLPEKESLYIEVVPMSASEGAKLLATWLAESHRTLQTKQRLDVMTKFNCCPYPLYLKLAFEEVRLWKSWVAQASLPVNLSPDISGILSDMFTRLEADRNHGRLLVSHAVGYLATSRHGLSEDELLDVLSADKEVMADFQKRFPKSPRVDRLPIVVWARLFADLEPYMTQRQAYGTMMLTFYHRQVGEVAVTRYLPEREKPRFHDALADFFEDRWRKPDSHAVSELPYHQMQAAMWPSLITTLTSYDFVEAKVMAGMLFGLLTDYQNAVGSIPNLPDSLTSWFHFVDQSSHLLCYEPNMVYQQSINQPSSSLVAESVLGSKTSLASLPYICWRNKPESLGYSPLLRTLVGHTCWVTSVAITLDGDHVLSGSSDGILRVWDIHTGRPLNEMKGHRGCVQDIVVAPDGRHVISASTDKTIKYWDWRTGQCCQTLEGHLDPVNSIAVTRDGRYVVSGSGEAPPFFGVPAMGKDDNTVRVWDLANGTCIRISEVHKEMVNCVAITPDGSSVLSGDLHGCVKIENLITGKYMGTLQGPSVPVLEISPDGRYVVSGPAEGALAGQSRLQIWNLGTLSKAGAFEHDIEVTAGILSPSGDYLIIGDRRGAITVWDFESHACVARLKGHTRAVLSLAMTQDGRGMVSCSADKTIRIWEMPLQSVRSVP